MTTYPKNFLLDIPKTDLHLHLDGSLRLSTLIDLAKENKITLPSTTEEGLNELVFKKNYESLDEYLKGFGYTCSVMQNKEALERIAYELAYDNCREGVRYIEVRFAPQLLMDEKKRLEDIIIAVDRGLQRAKKEINSNLREDEPPFEYGLIICAMRFFNENFSKYYAWFSQIHRYSSKIDKIKLASIELANGIVKIANESDAQIVGFDVAGSEYGNPAENHKKSYDIIHNHFIHKTIHAGEAYGSESIFQAITRLHTERIGHGLFLFDENMIFSDKIRDKKRYIEELANYIAERRITIEVCLTSNLQTVPSIKRISDHSFGKMLEQQLSVTLCTDNRLVSHTTVTNEIELATQNFNIPPKTLKNIIIYGFKRSFFYHPYVKKREYVRKVIDYYEKIEKKYGINQE
ncbi:MAG TPA: adenosine deaminase family protein [Spirochaetota bacterium]|jgi:adenosine deaminase|nr:MAG: Aminodeoxyfutalosine deaminase [Spirochaetes bacterium ADurb.Bin133]HNZ25893.1 adenosine deaminase family protein [Spirochaetota bacterium]HPY87682.1 adenosine deaminase family protein [Spirochaetota bacterium]HQB60156.1 adenosine deaminase family protein [Spirochaetota bacterium]